MSNNILILYSELMPYTMAMLDCLAENRNDLTLKVYSYGSNKKHSNYKASTEKKNIILRDESQYDDKKLLLELNDTPIALVVSGRMEKRYLNLARTAKKLGIKTIGLSDAQYHGNVRQKIAVYFSYFFYRRYFNSMFVPGLYQYEYAKQLGFSSLNIRTGLLSADVKLFNKIHFERANLDSFKGFLFIGRFIHRKSLDILLEAYQLYSSDHPNPNKLILVGQGDLQNTIHASPNIVVHPYLDQYAIGELMKGVKAFVLPSRFEAWGVVIHEAAAAGIPIITTRETGASTSFVKSGYNGLVIDDLNVESLLNSLVFFDKLNLNKIREYGVRSYELSRSITPELSVTQLLSLIEYRKSS